MPTGCRASQELRFSRSRALDCRRCNRRLSDPVKPDFEIVDMFLDQAIASLRLLFPSLKGSRCDSLERIQIIDVHAIHFMDGRVDVSRHRKVNNEKRPVAARLNDWLQLRPRDNCMGRRGGTYQDVQILKLVFPIIKADGASSNRLG